jgi:hypothetical protein
MPTRIRSLSRLFLIGALCEAWRHLECGRRHGLRGEARSYCEDQPSGATYLHDGHGRGIGLTKFGTRLPLLHELHYAACEQDRSM